MLLAEFIFLSEYDPSQAKSQSVLEVSNRTLAAGLVGVIDCVFNK